MQSIKEKLEKSKWVGHCYAFWQKIAQKYAEYKKYTQFAYLGAIIVLVGAGAFFSGRLMMIFETRVPADYVVSALSGISPVSASNAPQTLNKPLNQAVNAPKSAVNTANTANPAVSNTPGSYVASKTGKAYYFPWCAVALRIKDANKVWFATKAAAEAAGYKPAANCHGLK